MHIFRVLISAVFLLSSSANASEGTRGLLAYVSSYGTSATQAPTVSTSTATNATKMHSIPTKAPILLVPGIGGSLLKRPDGSNVWLNAEDLLMSAPDLIVQRFNDKADLRFREFMLGHYSSNGGLEPVFSAERLGVPSSLQGKSKNPQHNCTHNQQKGGLCGVSFLLDIPETAQLSRWNEATAHLTHSTSLSYFAEMVEMLEGQGYAAGQSLFGFPYDFRLSNRHHETLNRLDKLLAKITLNGTQKAYIISHSMGCILIKLYMAIYPENATKYIGKWIAIAGPFQGAAGRLFESLFSGYALGDVEICNCTARALAVQSASSFELLPSAWLEQHLPFNFTVTQGENTVFQATQTVDVLRLAQEAYQNHTFTFKGQTHPWPLNQDALAFAQASKALLAENSIPSSVQMYVMYGTQQQTPHALTVSLQGTRFEPRDLLCEEQRCDDSKCLEATKSCAPAFEYIDGDTTVPALSASSPFGDAEAEPKTLLKQAIPNVDHMGLVKDNGDVFNTLQKWLEISAAV